MIKRFLNIYSNKYAIAVVVLLLASFIIGLSSVFFRYPMSWFDEQVHYARVMTYADNPLSITRGKVTKDEQIFIQKPMEKIARSLGQPTTEIISSDWQKEFDGLGKHQERISTKDATAAAIYTPFVYAPYIIAAWIGKVLHLNVVTTFLLMRLSGFLLVFTMLVLAIRKIPFGKLTLAIIGSLPPVTISFAAISADELSYGFSFLFISYALSLYLSIIKDKKLNIKDIWLFILLSFCVVLTKIPAFLILGLHLPILYAGFKTKAINKKGLITLSVVLCICAIITIGWYMIVRNMNGNVEYYGRENVDQVRQIKFMLSHPLRTLRIFADNILNYPYNSMQLGYSDYTKTMSVPSALTLLSFIGLVLSIFIKDKDDESDFTDNQLAMLYNLASRLLFVGAILLIFIIFYLQNSEVASDMVVGVQPRYFLPFLLLLLPFTNKTLKYNARFMTGLVIISASPLIYYSAIFIFQLLN